MLLTEHSSAHTAAMHLGFISHVERNAQDPEVTAARDFNAFGTNFEGSPEPIYGTQFLPRKFKIGVTVPGDNSIDVLTNDLAIVVISDSAGQVKGYDILVGGGMGRAHRWAPCRPRDPGRPARWWGRSHAELWGRAAAGCHGRPAATCSDACPFAAAPRRPCLGQITYPRCTGACCSRPDTR